MTSPLAPTTASPSSSMPTSRRRAIRSSVIRNLGIRWILGFTLVAAFCWSAVPANAGRYAFNARAVAVLQSQLATDLQRQQASLPLNVALALLGVKPLKHPPPEHVTRIVVHCRGQEPTRLASGGTGYSQIRCTTNLVNTKDYLYSLDGGNNLITRRVDPTPAGLSEPVG